MHRGLPIETREVTHLRSSSAASWQVGAPPVERHEIGSQAVVLRGFAAAFSEELPPLVAAIARRAPFRRMETSAGLMTVALTNCGSVGWVSDRKGYRYTETNPATGSRWPRMPLLFYRLAREAAQAAGFVNFEPDACLINRYEIGSRLSLHQDKDECDFTAPIVSVSLGMSANFLFGGRKRADKTQTTVLRHGDALVWGGADRLRYHGVGPLKGDAHALLGRQRINLTFRKAR